MARTDKDLKEACVGEALAIIEQEGVDRLSLRDVARRLGVSHQAPYRHFPSRDHILAEVVARAFEGFACYLDTHPKSGDPDRDMGAMGAAYLDFAARHPLQYQLMFATALPNAEEHPEMMAKARYAFDLLVNALRRKAKDQGPSRSDEEIVLDALFVWSGLHGLAMLSNSTAMVSLGLSSSVLQHSTKHVLTRIGDALAQ